MISLIPANKHGYATPENVKFGPLLLRQLAALLPERSTRNTTHSLLMPLMIFNTLFTFSHQFLSFTKNTFEYCNNRGWSLRVELELELKIYFIYDKGGEFWGFKGWLEMGNLGQVRINHLNRWAIIQRDVGLGCICLDE